MVNNNLSDSEKILVKVDQNNLIYIDPNSVVDGNGNISPRNVKQENLMMYANLEADLIPRSIVKSQNDKNTLISIARGTLNFLRNQKGTDYDTKWTDSYFTENQEIDVPFGMNGQSTKISVNKDFYDETAQSFGIDSINVQIRGTNSIPQVSINFIDVRGKTLFESPENSPYNAFFHLPWPIFYLTLKGFYGKAIKYKLHLVKFTSKFSESTGNFEIQCTFVGSTFAFLNDIPLDMMKNAPYMYYIENTVDNKTDGTDTSIKISRGSKGYSILKSIYSEYKRKGLVSQDFPTKTLRELLMNAQQLDKILEEQILSDKLTPDIFVGLNDFQQKIDYFEKACIEWAKKYLSRNSVPDENKILCYPLNTNDNKNADIITGNTTGRLAYLVQQNSDALKKSHLFSEKLVEGLKNNKTGNQSIDITKVLAKPITWSDRYYRKNPRENSYEVRIDLLISDINEIKKTISSERNKYESYIEKKMNEIVNNKNLGLGFEPTIKNIFAVILANAEVYIRLMKDVHLRAFDVADERADIILKNNLSNETANDKPIYPWPEIKKNIEGEKENVIAYPGDVDLIEKLSSNDARLWPEVEFVENYIEIATNKVDPNSEKETGLDDRKFILPNDDNNNNTQPLNALSLVSNSIPYVDKTLTSILYEIWERSTYFTFFDSFNISTLEELADIEFTNLKNSVEDDNEIIALLNKINNEQDLLEYMRGFSPFDRYPYYQDQLPSVTYIRDGLSLPFLIQQNSTVKRASTTNTFVNLTKNINNYQPESYRKNIYPFNSDLYKTYINETTYSDDELKFTNEFEIDVSDYLIQTKKDNKFYTKNGYTDNLFKQKLKINNTDVSILNTTYFHRQLYYDFNNQTSYGKYAASAYLLLNSLPFKDLEDRVLSTTSKVRMSALFREIGATHFIPYHLICKWGSIYHRYKKYLINNVDILEDIVDVNNKTRPINGSVFFNNNETSSQYTGFTYGNETITYSNQRDIGVHPLYDAIFHQILNDYNHYDVLSGNTSFSKNVDDKKILLRERKESNNLNFWTSIVDNSKYYKDDLRYTLLPCDGANENINIIEDTTTGGLKIGEENFDTNLQKNFRVIWEDEYINDSYEGRLLPKANEYFLSYVSGTTNDKQYSIANNYRKIIDLIGTFSPSILEEFEDIFLNFSSERLNLNDLNFKYPNIKYTNFQNLLKDICSVNKYTSDTTNVDALIVEIRKRQSDKLKDITKIILSDTNYLKITLGNPKELDLHVLTGFLDINTGNTFSYNSYEPSQLTLDTKKLITLYLGEDLDNYYQNFFLINDVELNEENIIQFRFLIRIYAGYIKSGGVNTNQAFVQYLKDNLYDIKPNNLKSFLSNFETRRSIFLTNLIANFSSLQQKTITRTFDKISSGYNNRDPKIDTYNHFKSFNDKWIGGNSIGQRLLLEEFLFLDKANKDIGDKLFLNIDRLISLADPRNSKQNLYGVISLLLQDSGLDMRPLPAYVNFYGNNVKTKNRITPSKNVANNLFGTFLEVDYQESAPKIIIQYVGQSSKHLDVPNKKYKFADDSFDIGLQNKNPIIITSLKSFEQLDLSKSNRAVAFEVSFGDQNQSIFKGIQLDQSSIKNTAETFLIYENIARSESGAGAYNVDVGLYDYYRQASYTCEITCMGNVMIQPTMFFYLKNIPMFKGSYWITEVSHSIRAGNFTTSFKGTRIPYKSLPDPKDSFTSSYRVLLDRLVNKLIVKYKKSDLTLKTPFTFTYNGKQFSTDFVELSSVEDIEKIKIQKAGITEFFVPYNGYEINTIIGPTPSLYIQLVKYTNTIRKETEWLRARVVEMGGSKNPITDDTKMLIASRKNNSSVSWKDVKKVTNKDKSYYYSTLFDISQNSYDKITSAKTFFVNPKNSKNVEVKYEINNNVISGPIDVFANQDYGISMSKNLMKELDLYEGDVVYFVMY